MNKIENNGFLSERALHGHTVSGYLARISGDMDSQETYENRQKVFYTALFYLNQEVEEEITARKKELVLLKRVKASIVKGLVPLGTGMTEQSNKINKEKYLGSDTMEKIINFEVQLDMETLKKMEYIAEKEGKSAEQYLVDLLKINLKDIK